jgi:hypothetical protein
MMASCLGFWRRDTLGQQAGEVEIRGVGDEKER